MEIYKINKKKNAQMRIPNHREREAKDVFLEAKDVTNIFFK